MNPASAQAVVISVLLIVGAIGFFFLIKYPSNDAQNWVPKSCKNPAAQHAEKKEGQREPQISKKKKLEVFLFCLFLGNLGVHRFYVGKTGTGIIQLVTLGGLGVWSLCDFIMILCGSFRDADGDFVAEWL